MKSLFLVAAILASVPAFAAQQNETICTTPRLADDGFIATFSADERQVRLEEQTLHGPKFVADMECVPLITTLEISDVPKNTLLCRAPHTVNGALILRKYYRGLKANDFASVRAVTDFRGETVEGELAFGHLECAAPKSF